MASLLRATRRKIMTPPTKSALLSVRGFPERNQVAREALESAGRMFLRGYAAAAGQDTTPSLIRDLNSFEVDQRGFAFEGAAMASAMLDALPGAHRHHVHDLLAGAPEHVYMINVGVGWALARLPRWLHRYALDGLDDPVLVWLALDGYGFHQAYFHTQKYVHKQSLDSQLPRISPGAEKYCQRAVDQGIGRALWFVSGAEPAHAVSLVSNFAQHRHHDLFAGLGLAITYAGGASMNEVDELGRIHLPGSEAIAQGAVFAAEARRLAHIVTPYTRATVMTLAGVDVDTASEIAGRTRPQQAWLAGDVGYEVWRRRIISECTRARIATNNPVSGVIE